MQLWCQEMHLSNLSKFNNTQRECQGNCVAKRAGPQHEFEKRRKDKTKRRRARDMLV